MKESATADLAARATAVRDETKRREVLTQVLAKIEGDQDIDAWINGAPLVHVEFTE